LAFEKLCTREEEFMIDLKFLRENADVVATAAKNKRVELDLNQILELDEKLVALKTELQKLQELRNAHSKKIPKASAEERPALIEEGREIGLKVDQLKPTLTDMERELEALLLLVPQIPDPSVPIGKDENDNVEVKRVGSTDAPSFELLDHVEILEKQEWADFERIAEVSGSRSYSLRNEMVLLELALHRLALDVLAKKGFTLVSAPAFCRRKALVGTGHLPTGEDQVYHLPEDDLYLSGTSEVQINSLYSDEILKESELPLLFAGYSACFRREAGSYGRDVRGLMRVHQFMKVEQYIICKNDPEESKKWHQALLETSEEIVQLLEVPYRVIECCTGDMGAGKVKMFDVECWVPSEQRFRETHSCSALHDWQSRRTETRYRDNEGKVQYVHTLNNTAIATPRILVPFLENHQQPDGTIRLPKAVQAYMGGMTSLGRAFR
jgi:seryl-tRNA synthetase